MDLRKGVEYEPSAVEIEYKGLFKEINPLAITIIQSYFSLWARILGGSITHLLLGDLT